MHSRNLLFVFIIFLLIINPSFAQTISPQKDTASKPVPKDVCDCLKPAIDAIQKAYTSLEEDEWPAAIKTSKDTIDIVSNLAKVCKCPEITSYQKVSEAFSKYAEGGNHLDGVDEPNCPYALKLYSAAAALLKEAIPNITNVQVKENAENTNDYVTEELEFVKNECNSVGESKQNKK